MGWIPFLIQKTEATFAMSLLVTSDSLPMPCRAPRAGAQLPFSLGRILRRRAALARLAWPPRLMKPSLLLPRLPCSSLCFCPLSFSHCWQCPALGSRKSGGGAWWQGCGLPVPDGGPYLFARPGQPTCTTAHILALPS